MVWWKSPTMVIFIINIPTDWSLHTCCLSLSFIWDCKSSMKLKITMSLPLHLFVTKMRKMEKIWIFCSLDTGDLIITSVQPSNAVNYRLHCIVFILVFKSGHRWFTCCQCPNLNLSQWSKSESDTLRIHGLLEGEIFKISELWPL